MMHRSRNNSNPHLQASANDGRPNRTDAIVGTTRGPLSSSSPPSPSSKDASSKPKRSKSSAAKLSQAVQILKKKISPKTSRNNCDDRDDMRFSGDDRSKQNSSWRVTAPPPTKPQQNIFLQQPSFKTVATLVSSSSSSSSSFASSSSSNTPPRPERRAQLHRNGSQVMLNVPSSSSSASKLKQSEADQRIPTDDAVIAPAATTSSTLDGDSRRSQLDSSDELPLTNRIPRDEEEDDTKALTDSASGTDLTSRLTQVRDALLHPANTTSNMVNAVWGNADDDDEGQQANRSELLKLVAKKSQEEDELKEKVAITDDSVISKSWVALEKLYDECN
eukprot:scaffold4675_cov101-Cylindrotheca_fusiformis.AAC.2